MKMETCPFLTTQNFNPIENTPVTHMETNVWGTCRGESDIQQQTYKNDK